MIGPTVLIVACMALIIALLPIIFAFSQQQDRGQQRERQQKQQQEVEEGSERVAVHLHEGVDANELAAKHGYQNIGGVHGLEHHYVFQKLPPSQHRADVVVDKHIGEHEHVKWWQSQNQRRLKRPLPHWNGEDERLAAKNVG